MKKITLTLPLKTTKYRPTYKGFNVKRRQLTRIEVFVICIEAKLTSYQYNVIRQNDKFMFLQKKIG